MGARRPVAPAAARPGAGSWDVAKPLLRTNLHVHSGASLNQNCSSVNTLVLYPRCVIGGCCFE